jgi:ligand-binding sensor domain-containing protein
MGQRVIVFFLFLFAWIKTTELTGQQRIIQFDRFNLQQGLSQGSVYCILQDHKGFMWFGTQDGLNQYDGYNFIVYRHNKYNPSSISDNFIKAIHEDQQGNIWIGTLSGGLDRFDRSTGNFTSYQFNENDPAGISSDNISSIFQDQSGDLWIGTDNGLNKMVVTPSGQTSFITFYHNSSDKQSISDNVVTAIFEDRYRNLWIGTQKGLNKYDPSTNSFFPFHLQADKKGRHITAIAEGNAGTLLVGTHDDGLFRAPVRSNVTTPITFEPFLLSGINSNVVSALLTDANGNLWIGLGEEGLVRWDRQSNDYYHLRSNPAQPQSLSNNLVYALFFDTFGNLWVGTLNGINKYSEGNQKFAFYQNAPGTSGHNSNSIFAIVKDGDGNIWTGTREGLFRQKKSSAGLYLHPERVEGLLNHAVRSLHVDKNGRLWVGTEGGSLEKYDEGKKRFLPISISPELAENPIYVIRENEPGMLWLGTYNGLYSLNPENREVRYYDWQRSIRTSTKSREIRGLAIDEGGNVWIGTRGAGLFYFDKQKETFTNFKNDPKDSFSISHNVVASIHIDPASRTLWLGTASGLNRFQLDKKKFYSYTERDGLPNDVVYGILNDNQGHLWLSTNNGLVRFHPKENTFRSYDVTDGLQGNEFNAGAYYRSKDGELFFGGLNGHNVFYPEQIKDNILLPEIVLTGFKVLNEAVVLKSSLAYIDQINLTHKDYVFSFEFSAIHLSAPEKNQYAYMLEGFDPDWVYTQRRFATYTNLDPGTYTFRVKASNNDGIWNEKGLAIKIYIKPPFWKTWWFYGLIFVALSGVVYALYQFRVGQIRAEEKLKTEFNKKLAEVEMTALRAQMNPHFLFNCLNSINRYIVRSDPETASNYLTKFSRLIRLILQNSKASTVSLKSELEALKLYIEMEEMRFDNRFEYSIGIDKTIEPEFVEVPPLLLQPYVENAIWHGLMHKGSKGKLTVDIAKENGWLRCVIEDNGIGRAKAQQLKSKSATRDKSMGIKITTDRLNLYHTHTEVEIIDLMDSGGMAVGTRVVVDIPYSSG